MKKLGKTIAAGSPAFILLYISYLIVFNVPIIHTIDIGSAGDMDAGKDAYMRDLTEQGRLTQSMSIDGETFRNMTGSPVYFYVKPATYIKQYEH